MGRAVFRPTRTRWGNSQSALRIKEAHAAKLAGATLLELAKLLGISDERAVQIANARIVAATEMN